MEDDRNEILSLAELKRLRRDNPAALFAHLEAMRRELLFGVEDHREEEERWGGELRVVINKNVVLHLVPALSRHMPSSAALPQFCVMPDAARADRAQETSQVLDDGERITGVVFYVDPDDYDAMAREAAEVVADYGSWDAIPDTYYAHTALVRFLTQVVCEHPVVARERDHDFRMGLVGGVAPPLPAEDRLSAEELIARYRSTGVVGADDAAPEAWEPEPEGAAEGAEGAGEDAEEGDEGEDEGGGGLRSLPVRWG